jgi:hypothetical protein
VAGREGRDGIVTDAEAFLATQSTDMTQGTESADASERLSERSTHILVSNMEFARLIAGLDGIPSVPATIARYAAGVSPIPLR